MKILILHMKHMPEFTSSSLELKIPFLRSDYYRIIKIAINRISDSDSIECGAQQNSDEHQQQFEHVVINNAS